MTDTNNPSPVPETRPLARALMRIAALQGVVLPEFEVHQTLVAASGDAAGFSRVVEATWQKLISGGTVRTVLLCDSGSDDLPMLVEEPNGVVVVRSRSGEGWQVETPDGEPSLMTFAAGQEAIALRTPVLSEARETERRHDQRTSTTWFWREIRRHMPTFGEVGLASVAANLLALAGSLFAMQVYDRVVPNLAYQTLWVLAGGVALGILFEMAIRAARAQLLDHACKQIDLRLSDGLFRHLIGIRLNARPQALGTLAAQIRDFETVRNFLTSSTLFVLADAPFVLLFLFVMWLVGGAIVVVPAAALTLTLILGIASQWPLRKLSHLHVKETNERNGLLIEAIDGAEMIKATGAEWQMARQWNSLTEQLSADGLRMRTASNLMVGTANAIQQVAYAGMIVLGAYLIGDGKLTVGALVACSILSGRVLSPTVQVVTLAYQWNYARAALKTLDGLMALPTDGPPPGERPVVKEQFSARLGAENLGFQYDPKAPRVVEVGALRFQPGERVAILGPTGSGKSTLLKMLAGVYSPSQGRVLLDGIDMAQLDPHQVRQHVGYLPQHVRLFQGTLRDNLTLGLPPASDDEILEAARVTGVDRIIERHPKGMGLPLFEGGFGLSGGQSQSVGLTRSLLGHPRLLLLDEPTASMDPALEVGTVRSILAYVKPDQTLVCVTHKPAVLHAMDRLVVLDRGRIVMDGPREEVLRKLNAPRGAAA